MPRIAFGRAIVAIAVGRSERDSASLALSVFRNLLFKKVILEIACFGALQVGSAVGAFARAIFCAPVHANKWRFADKAVAWMMRMFFDVLRARHDLQVFWPVVKFVAVDVVNNFVLGERAAKHIFRDLAMLKNKFSAAPSAGNSWYEPVAIGVHRRAINAMLSSFSWHIDLRECVGGLYNNSNAVSN